MSSQREVLREFIDQSGQDAYEIMPTSTSDIGEVHEVMTSQHPWIHFVAFRDSEGVATTNYQTQLNYRPHDHKELTRQYRQFYRGLVEPSRKSLEITSVDREALTLTKHDMERDQLNVLGALAIFKDTRLKEPVGNLFVSKILIKNLSLTLRQTILAAGEPPLDIDQETIEWAKSIKTMQPDAGIRSAGSLIMRLLPNPATVSPRFTKN